MSNKAYFLRFWNHLIDRLTELDPWYNRFKSCKQKATGWNTGKPGIGLWFRLRAGYLEAAVTIEDTGIDRIDYFWSQLKEEQSFIDSNLPVIPSWDPASGRVTASRIGTKVTHPGWNRDDWWDDIIVPIKQIMDGYREVILPSIEALEDLQTTHFYAIQICDGSGSEVDWMGGISYHPPYRLKQHVRNFSKHSVSSNWSLSLIDSIQFETEAEARKFESEMLASEIRAPNIEGLSSELFISNPIEWARDNGYINR